MLKKDIKFLTVDILVFGFWSKLLGRIECRRVWRNTTEPEILAENPEPALSE